MLPFPPAGIRLLSPRLGFFALLTFVFLLVFSLSGERSHTFDEYTKKSDPDLFTRNGTLGFQKIIAIGFPDRSDRRDAMALSARVTGFDLEWLDSMHGEQVDDEAVPQGWNRKEHEEVFLGAWRDNMNALQRIVDNGYTSALIMQDNIDWDVNIKDQLEQFVVGSKQIASGIEPVPKKGDGGVESPYGPHWEMLWLGSCATNFPEDLKDKLKIDNPDKRKYLISKDKTVPGPKSIKGNVNFSWSDFEANTRVVHVVGDNYCLNAYAVTRRGAEKMLFHMKGQEKPFEQHVSDMCRLREMDIRCVGVVPTLFSEHKAKGSGREEGETAQIVYSTRLNLQRLLRGDGAQAQYKD